MALVKKEVICTSSCDKQYILVVQEEDAKEPMYCPFCQTPIAEGDEPEEESE